MKVSVELEQAVAAAGRELLTMYGLMAAHGIPDIVHLRLLLAWPAGMQDAYRGWMSSMVQVVNLLGHAEGIQDMRALSERDKVRLTERAYTLVLDSQAGGTSSRSSRQLQESRRESLEPVTVNSNDL